MLFLLKSILRWCVNSPPKCWSFLTESHVDFFFQPNYAEIIHIPESKASLLIGYLSIASTLSRFLFGLVLNHPRINRFYVLQVCKEMLLWRLYPVLAQKKRNLCVNWVDLISRLRVVPHFSSGRVERAKRERNASARKNHPTREKATRGVCPFLAWGDFHGRSRFARSTLPEEQ